MSAIKDSAMTKHTPGPWEWRYCVGGYPELVHPKRGLLLVMDAVREGMHRATLRFARRTTSDVGGLMFKAAEFFVAPGKGVADLQVPTNPDMRLIAAAPDLLEALRDLVERCDGEDGVRSCGSNIQTIRAHAAISKAEGEQSA